MGSSATAPTAKSRLQTPTNAWPSKASTPIRWEVLNCWEETHAPVAELRTARCSSLTALGVGQVAAGLGQSLFLVESESEIVKKLDEFHPEVEVEPSKDAEDILDDASGKGMKNTSVCCLVYVAQSCWSTVKLAVECHLSLRGLNHIDVGWAQYTHDDISRQAPRGMRKLM